MINKLSQINLGILGSGQLARMLALKCHTLGIKPYVLGAHSLDPAAQVTTHFIKGDANSKKDLKNFFKKVDCVIFENEFLDSKLLTEVSINCNTPIYPQPKIMHFLQDRLSQKHLLKKYKIPTAPFIELQSYKQINKLNSLFPLGTVLKKRRQGYDGYGTLIVKNIITDAKAKQFINNFPKLIAEEFIPFKKELAIILVRNKKNQIIEMPLVETYQENAKCMWVKGPSVHKKKDLMVKKLKLMMTDLQYEGVLAIEFFETKKGVLLVNELAPRVHNSGHYSMDALSEDQFTLHIKAILNLDLNTPIKKSGGFAMLNLLGDPTCTKWLPPKNTILHWYGKTECRLDRKMGHLNCLEVTPNKALNILLKDK